MIQPTYIVTGATGGIGQAIVQQLAETKSPCHIIMAVRATDRGEAIAQRVATPSATIEVRSLDLADMKSVAAFAHSIISDGIRVTALINNAGIMPGGVTLTHDGLEMATQTNFVATALLTHLLLPSMTDGGSITFTTSVTRYLPRLHRNWADLAINRHQRFVTYGRSKLMLTHYALWLSRQLASHHIRVNCSDPGIADTGIIRLGHNIIDRMADLILRPCIHTPQQGATAAMRAATAPTSGYIFTVRGKQSISARWADTTAHHQLIDDLQQYFRRYEKLC